MDVSPVRLHVYDISRGIAARLSPILLGREVPGLWHTNIVVGDVELSYGPPIRRYPAGRGPLGTPSRIIDLGDTALPLALLNELVTDMARPGGKFSEEAYDILYNNCNTFANEMAGILTGMSVPADILNQSQEWLSSPLLGQILVGRQSGDCDAAQPGPERDQRTPTQPGGSAGAGPSKSAATPTAPTAAGAAGGSTSKEPPAPNAAAPPSKTPGAGRVPDVWGGLEELLRDVLRGAAWDEQGGNPWRHAAAVRSMLHLWEEVAERVTGVAAAAAAAGGDGGGDGPVAAADAGAAGAQGSCGASPAWAEGLAQAARAAAEAAGIAAGGVFGAVGDAASGPSGAAPAAGAGCCGPRRGCCGRRPAAAASAGNGRGGGPAAAAFQPRGGAWAPAGLRRCPIFRSAYPAVPSCVSMGPGGSNGINGFGRLWSGGFGSYRSGCGAGRCCPKACCGGDDAVRTAAAGEPLLNALLSSGGIGLPGFGVGLGLGLGLGLTLHQGHCKGASEGVRGLGGAGAAAGDCCRCCDAVRSDVASGLAPPPPPFFVPEVFPFFDPVAVCDIFAEFAQAAQQQQQQQFPAAAASAASAAASGADAAQGWTCCAPPFWGYGRRFGGRGAAAGCGGGRGCGPRRAAAAATAAAANAEAAATDVQEPANKTVPATHPPAAAAQSAPPQPMAAAQPPPSAATPAVVPSHQVDQDAPSSVSEGSAGGGWLEVEGLEAVAGEAAGPSSASQ